MSLELETEETVSAETALVESPTLGIAVPRLPFWRRRHYQVGVLTVAIVFVAALVGSNVLARQYTPEGAVRQYLSALQSGDAGKAWEAIQVSAPTALATANLTDRAALQAALAAGKPDIRSFTVTRTSQLSSTSTAVEVTYDTSTGSKQAKFIAARSGQTHFGVYPAWHLVIAPALLQIALPKGSSRVSIDGKPVALPDGKSKVAVLPLRHKLEFTGTGIFARQTLDVDAFLSLGQSVDFQPSVTAAGLDMTKAAVKQAFETCAKQTSSSATGCPSAGLSPTESGQWTLVGDPTQDLAVSFDQDRNVFAAGHYQMVFRYEYHGTQHQPSAGPFKASLVLSKSDITVASIQPADGVPGLQRPSGVSDQAARDLVAKAFAQCAAAQAPDVADCPQRLIEALVSEVQWSLIGDPLAGATVTFDSKTALFVVHGNFNMRASYRSGGYARNPKGSLTTAYNAYLMWDGQALQLVTINGTL